MSKSTDIAQHAKQYIIDCLGNEDISDDSTAAERVAHMRARFHAEHQWLIDRKGEQAALCEWLQGLAISIAYTNYDIVQLAKEWGSLPETSTDNQEWKIINNYFKYMATKCQQLMRTEPSVLNRKFTV